MKEGWKCPSCGKAHGPHVDTCPEQGFAPVYVPPYPDTNPVPWTGDRPIWRGYEITCGSAGYVGPKTQSWN